MSKLFVMMAFLISASAFAEPYEDFGEAAGMYIGSCYGLEHLKFKYCPQQSQVNPAKCVDNVTSLVPTADRNEASKIFNKTLASVKKNVIDSIDVGFNKVLAITKGDSEKACLGYGSSLNTVSYMKFEELKVISKRLK